MCEMTSNACYERWLSPMTYDLHNRIRRDRELLWDYLEFTHSKLGEGDSITDIAAKFADRVRDDERINRTFSERALARVIWPDVVRSFANQLR